MIVFHRSLSKRKSHQVSRTLGSILANCDNSLVSTCPLISNNSITFSYPYNWYASFFLVYLQGLSNSLFLYSLYFNLLSAGTAKSTIWQILSLFYLSIFLKFIL